MTSGHTNLGNSLRNKILAPSNIYAAAYALPGFLSETGLVAIVNEDDTDLYKTLRNERYAQHSEFCEECLKELRRMLEPGESDLFNVSLFLKLKGNGEYRPIHTADIKTLVCLQSIANTLLYDDDHERGTRSLSPIARLVPPNFYGNILDTARGSRVTASSTVAACPGFVRGCSRRGASHSLWTLRNS